MYTVGRLARKHGLSRSTLLYYHRLGVLSPSGHSKGEYRSYSDADSARLGKICEYRRAGIPLKTIASMLDGDAETVVAEALERRLIELNEEMADLREQQRVVTRLLGRRDLVGACAGLDKEAWVALLEAAGFSEEDMQQWHVRFERGDPERHEAFLRRLAIPEEEIFAIRAASAKAG
ncbi:MerR family transcriptional regulator [Pseudodesulfovibrio cashew]|uniref:MerR family transcriptional regulator n=1 Tax=Pseudodesulfovibrio cashew TaxID=2678688 RepID=A0A6I6JH46_9BACT|nr:MerR family transcriptional regulator [Pseudodesulfovibrio cashew]QGY39833.1 MerR family transcriptional regulator [Pseudodesulfovibrio cashew]